MCRAVLSRKQRRWSANEHAHTRCNNTCTRVAQPRDHACPDEPHLYTLYSPRPDRGEKGLRSMLRRIGIGIETRCTRRRWQGGWMWSAAQSGAQIGAENGEEKGERAVVVDAQEEGREGG